MDARTAAAACQRRVSGGAEFFDREYGEDDEENEFEALRDGEREIIAVTT
jgi:hypothetical protein